MSKKENKFFKLIKDFWHGIEPMVLDWLVFLFIIFLLAIITYLTKDYIPPEFEDNIKTIKSIAVYGALGLFVSQMLIIILIRVIKKIIKEIRKVDDENDDDENENDDNDDDGKNNKISELPPSSTDFDEISEIQNSEEKEVEQVKRKRGK